MNDVVRDYAEEYAKEYAKEYAIKERKQLAIEYILDGHSKAEASKVFKLPMDVILSLEITVPQK